MKKVFYILITLFIILVFSSCTASQKTDSTADASASAAESAGISTTENDTTEAVTEMTEYKSKVGNLSYPAEYKDDYVINEREEEDNHIVEFNANINGKDYLLFNLIIVEDGDSEYTITDSDGNRRYVEVDMPQIDETDLSEEELDRIYSLQEGVNDILDSLD